ncbi:hypothetical protein JYU34_014254 [Plutella xylostella]|uniref:Polynucleotide 5'-hydroxyl-kinase NOL9 n=1 Tax=Plutella xylostella TaxID=51655 RepID=A0ABQ7Q9C9_PLUXY|nr:hypothetical protein JYU34_014254 [Plutella xylostella]
METFEKAHVLKKDKKSEESMKKQLRQMLYGYKHNDNQAIKDAAAKREYFEDTLSVSGFSELDLSSRDDAKEDISDPDDVSISNADELDTSMDSELSKELDINQSNSNTVDSMSEDEDKSHELLDDIIQDSDSSFSFDQTTSTEIASENEVFDADGALASKILKNLESKNKGVLSESVESSDSMDSSDIQEIENINKTEKVYKKTPEATVTKSEKQKKNNNKRKLTSADQPLASLTMDRDDVDSVSEQQNIPQKNKSKKANANKNNKKDNLDNISEQQNRIQKNKSKKANADKIHKSADMVAASDSESCQSLAASSDQASLASLHSPSPPFVLCDAENTIYYKEFNDLLSAYRNPTMKNLPSEVPVFSSKSSAMFSSTYNIPPTEDRSADEDVSSLGDLESVSSEMLNEIELSPEFNSTAELPELPVQDLSLQSEDVSEAESSVDFTEEPVNTNQVEAYCSKNCCIFVLRHPAELYMHGKVVATSLAGTTEVVGHILKDSCKIFAPYINYAQCLKTVECENSYYGLFSKLTAAGLSVAEAEEIVTSLGEYDSVIQLKPLNSRKLDFVENNFNVTDLFNKPIRTAESSLRQASEKLGCSFYLQRPRKYFDEKDIWGKIIQTGSKPHSRGLVCGGKGTGKSTFLRYYVNRLAARGPVLVLDLDPGQCEFTVAGNLSATVVTEPLLGPNFTHLKTPERMLNIGMINVMDNLRRYTNAVASLISYCSSREQYRRMPWIVNTMGMCTPVGLKLLTLILLHLKPTFVVQMDSTNAKKRFECNLDAQTVMAKCSNEFRYERLLKDVRCPGNLDYEYFLSEQYTEGVGRGNNYCLAPRDERYLNYLAYFGELMDLHKDTEFLGIVPYEVPLAALRVGANVRLAAAAAGRVINGKVVALCQHGPADSTSKIFTLDDKPILCHGYGLVRGVDYESGLVYVVTPAARLGEVDTLVYADWAPELRGPERRLPAGAPVPYRTATLHNQKQLLFTPKRRFNPLQFLKMSRSA